MTRTGSARSPAASPTSASSSSRAAARRAFSRRPAWKSRRSRRSRSSRSSSKGASRRFTPASTPGSSPDTASLAFEKERGLAYGENPHQRAAYYALRGARSHLLSRVEQLRGKPLSFNNLNDLSAARLLLAELDDPACVIVKHANPCGVAVAGTIDEAYENA